GGRRAAAGEAGAADFPERERMTEEDTFAAHADCPRSRFNFVAPASPAAARPPHDPPAAPRSLPIPTRDKVSRRFRRAAARARPRPRPAADETLEGFDAPPLLLGQEG